MVRKSGVVLLGILVGLFLLVASWPYLSYQVDNPTGAVTGNSVREAIGDFYETSSVGQRIFILSQILLLIVIVVVAFVVIRRLGSKSSLTKRDYNMESGGKRSRTDLDILYEMLKKEAVINMEDAERVFRVDSDIALGWFKVLEDGDLAEIDYPRFGKPVLRLIEKDAIENMDVVEEETVEKKKEMGIVSGKVGGKRLKGKVVVGGKSPKGDGSRVPSNKGVVKRKKVIKKKVKKKVVGKRIVKKIKRKK